MFVLLKHFYTANQYINRKIPNSVSDNISLMLASDQRFQGVLYSLLLLCKYENGSDDFSRLKTSTLSSYFL